ncbi:MAG: hypothetical protein LC624_10075 [Halobacteriales archaeon]|nr:hypothetical protein [Halobacteriales archaeon]
MPIRARWVLTTKWGVPKGKADALLREFLEQQPRVEHVGADRETLVRAFALAGELGHDVHGTFLLALALDHGIEGLLTTDVGLRGPCARTGLVHDNPMPASVLRKFSGVRTR